MLAANRQGWQDPRILTMLLFVFLSGSVVGAFSMRVWLHDRLHRGLLPQKADVQLSYDRLNRELNLTPEQAAKLRAILDDFVVYRHDIEAQVTSFRATGKNRILQILTPEQRTRFERICSEVAAP
jgi:Spy/CpxP family protein refolding chaperone